MIYLSPHLDDVALSCGGLIWEQTNAGKQVEIWTICAGDPPAGDLSPFAEELHCRWGTGRDATSHRRNEDINSCKILGSRYRHLEIPDAIYRRHPKTGEVLYHSAEILNEQLAEIEASLIKSLTTEIARLLPENPVVVSPIALGNHVDHQVTRAVAERLNVPLTFYADYPYVEEEKGRLHFLLPPGYQPQIHPISKNGLKAWQDSIAVHESQISTFWENEQAMRHAVSRYHNEFGGIPLWTHTTHVNKI
jgi:LmbE family N-acetylglucosaminyl deacetylase